MRKKILYWAVAVTFFCGWVDLVWGQQTFTEAEVITILGDRDAQWKGKIEKADSLIAGQKILINDCGNLTVELEESGKVDSLLLIAKSKQIELLKAREVMNEKMANLVKPKWYEHRYIWLVIGFVVGSI